jgi:hypothetical protein
VVVHKLFGDFLETPEAYHACEQYWEQLVREIAVSLAQAGEWERWIPRHFANGTPFELDGNPIFDARSKKLNRAFRIIQHRPEKDELEIAAWIKTYEEEYIDLPRAELVINLSLSQESADVARRLLVLWMTPTTTVDEMQLFIRQHIMARQ